MTSISIPDSVRGCLVEMEFKLAGMRLESISSGILTYMSGIVIPASLDDLLLLEHLDRLTSKASKTNKFSLLAKFDCTLNTDGETFDCLGSWVRKTPFGNFVVYFDVVQRKNLE